MPANNDKTMGLGIEGEGEPTPLEGIDPAVPVKVGAGKAPALRPLRLSVNGSLAGRVHSVGTAHGQENELAKVHPDALIQALAGQVRLDTIDLTKEEQSLEAKDKLHLEKVIRRFRVFPLRIDHGQLVVVVSSLEHEEDIKFAAGMPVRLILDSQASVDDAIEQYYGIDLAGRAREGCEVLAGGDREDKVDRTQAEAEGKDPKVSAFVDSVLNSAIEERASDILFERYRDYWRIRFSIDGSLVKFVDSRDKGLPPEMSRIETYRMIVSRIKIMAEMDIAETRAPQDGLLRVELARKRFEFRVATAPMQFGEMVVMRNFPISDGQCSLNGLGFSSGDLEIFRAAISLPQGLILVTGPTGSGKTTTLEGALYEANTIDRNIMTVEDPVERPISGVNQVQVNEKAGVTFASVLRAFLRMRPSVILVGEIRDFETADVVVKAALTGHLVLATLHTNNTIQSINRLLDMGIERFNLLPMLMLVCAQRLVRRICDRCKPESDNISTGRLVEIGFTHDEAMRVHLFRGSGIDRNGRLCKKCKGTGFFGRTAVYEMMRLTPELRAAFINERSTDEILPLAQKQGMVTLRRAAIQKVLEGVTTVSEVLRVTPTN